MRHCANDWQFKGDSGSSTEIGGVSSYTSSFVGPKQEVALNARNSDQQSGKDSQHQSVEANRIDGHPQRLGFAAVLSYFCCGLLIAGLLLWTAVHWEQSRW
jgi:hypothetical protein